MMNRAPDHVFQFMMAELGTEGSIDGNQRLVIKGKFVTKVCFLHIKFHFLISPSTLSLFFVSTSSSMSPARCVDPFKPHSFETTTLVYPSWSAEIATPLDR